MRPKLTIPAQINDMKAAGITFEAVSDYYCKAVDKKMPL